MQSDDGELLLNCVIQSRLLEVWQHCYLITFIGWSFSSAIPFKKLDRGNICLHKSREICKAEVSPQKTAALFFCCKITTHFGQLLLELAQMQERERSEGYLHLGFAGIAIKLDSEWTEPSFVCRF